jgi:hypothetical protein
MKKNQNDVNYNDIERMNWTFWKQIQDFVSTFNMEAALGRHFQSGAEISPACKNIFTALVRKWDNPPFQ